MKEQSAEAESMIDAIGREADFRIDNSNDLESLRKQVREFLYIKLNL